jgi:hypothetical protein
MIILVLLMLAACSSRVSQTPSVLPDIQTYPHPEQELPSALPSQPEPYPNPGPYPEPETATANDPVLLQPTANSSLHLPLIDSSPSALWQPGLIVGWQWQLTGTLDTSVMAPIFDIDLFDTDASQVSALHAQDRKVICYINMGVWENWRPDISRFPPAVLGKDVAGWPGEKWLDIRQIDLIAPALRARLDQCLEKGFDGVEADNLDGYANNTGFPLSAQDQLTFNRWIADEAHRRSLSIALKNDGEQVSELLPDFDFAIVEDCFAHGECASYSPFITAGKPVFAVEYTDSGLTFQDICAQASTLKFNVILKNRNLDAFRQVCP